MGPELQGVPSVFRPGPKFEELGRLVPQVMAELTEQYIASRGLAERAVIKLRMRAIQDLFGADTEYPARPDLNNPPRPPMAGAAARPYIPQPVPPAGAGLDELRAQVGNALGDEEPRDDGFAPAPGMGVPQRQQG